MGYTTDFTGEFEFNKKLLKRHADYISKFNTTRRMKRNPEICERMPDPLRKAVGLPVGPDGAFFVGAEGFMGQENDESVADHNVPPGQLSYRIGDDFRTRWDENKRRSKNLECQPGLWCQWEISEDRQYLQWDEGEKFYYYTEWLRYLIKNFFEPWGYKLNGEVEWHGEAFDDRGVIICKDNVVEVQEFLSVRLTQKEKDCLGPTSDFLEEKAFEDGAMVLRKILEAMK